MSEAEEFLEHYGVKGMKWGVRKDRSRVSVPGRKRSRKEQAARKQREDIRARRRQLSDKDLNKFIERLNNEKKLKTLVDEDINPGKTIAKRIMSQSGEKVVKTVLTGGGLLLVKTAVEKKFGDDAGKWIPKLKKA